MNKKILALGLCVLTSLSAVACTGSQSQASNLANTSEVVATSSEVSAEPSAQQDKGATKQINAKFMREHIFDYKANPSKFVFKGSRPAIIDFYADWCGPCRQLSPRLESLAKKYAGQIDVYKVNVDNEAELASVFGVQSIPMLLFIDTDGSTPSVSQGLLSVEDLEKEIQRLLK